MKTQIPIYRGKKIDSDEYVEGNLQKATLEDLEVFYIVPFDVNTDYSQIDPSTLAIHFPDMIDSEGTKIFASLSEDGRGGDIVSLFETSLIVRYYNGQIHIHDIEFNHDMLTLKKEQRRKLKVTGIQE